MAFQSPLAWYWVVAPVVVMVLGVLLLLRGILHLAFGRVGRCCAHCGVGIPLAVGGLIVGLLVLNTQSYARLTEESAVAEVGVAALNPAADVYRVTVRRLDGTGITVGCVLRGDEWELSARVQKWKPWANVLGLDATYTLDQIGNKFFTAARGDGRTITACDLSGPPPDVNQLVPAAWLDWLRAQSFAEQRRFGSAVYMPMTDGALYRVTMTQSGLNAEAVNPIAQRAIAAGI